VGILPGKLHATGIPVAGSFHRHINKAQARQALELPQTGRVFLLSCGSMGAGPIRPIATYAERILAPGDYLVVVCGSNKRLFRELSFLFSQSDRVRVLGFTDKMRQYMAACDLLISKAGGLTTTEAVASGTPLLYLNAVPGCESRNIAFMAAHGYAIAAKDDLHFLPLLRDCLTGNVDLEASVRAREGAFPPHPAKAIYDLSHAFQ
jgi:processive 1,2-diacylglycerol beta-glucosyltransferase